MHPNNALREQRSGTMRERIVVPAVPASDAVGDGPSAESVRAAWCELGWCAEHFFQTPEWIQSVAAYAPRDLAFGVLREDERPVAASVLRRSVHRYAGVVFTILHNGIYFYLVDGLVDPAVRDRITIEDLADVFDCWDVLHLARLRVGSPWLELADAHKHVRSEPGPGVAVLDTSMAFDERWVQMPKKLRASIRNARNRIEACGGAEIAVARCDDVAAAFDRHIELEAAGWKGTGGAALAHTAWKQDPWRAYVRASGSPEIHTLTIGGRLAASLCGTLHAGTFSAMFTTYDEGLSEFSPGSVLWAEVIASCCADNTIRRFDSLAWHPWLDRWAFDHEPTYELLAFNSGARGNLARLGYRLRSRSADLRRRLRSWPAPEVHRP